MRQYLTSEISITASSEKAAIVRTGWRSVFNSAAGENDLTHFVAGQLPYYYREPEKIAADFARRHNALDLITDLAIKAPTTSKFQQSHCGEIFCALYVEKVLGFRRLYSKLTLTTAEDTNVHKMDAFFVDTSTSPFTYLEVEAKSSILPTEKSPFKGHRHGILSKMIESFEAYDPSDERFDFTAIRDNLERSNFTPKEAEQICNDLVPPGPQKLVRMGMATINEATICSEDDDFILTAPCKKSFNYRALIVADLARLASEAYGKWKS